MKPSRRRILVAVEPGVLEGALAKLLSAASDDEVVQLRRTPGRALQGYYSVAVVSDELPVGVKADVVITLPDTRGSGGAGSVRRGRNLDEVSIQRVEQLLELLKQYVPA